MKKTALILLLTFCFTSNIYADDIYEPNNTFATAAQVSAATYTISVLDADWFKVDLTTGSLQLTMTPLTSTDLNMILYNDQEQIVGANFNSGAETINYDVLIAGTYYISIEPTSSLTSDATLIIDFTSNVVPDDTYEPNDSFAEAKQISNGTYTLSGQDTDWFKIDLFDGNLQLSMTPTDNVDLNMILYDANQQAVAANFSTGTETINYDVVSSGTYYLKVEPTSPYTTDYTLNVNHSTLVVWETQLDFGPIRDVSVALFDIDKDGKDEIFVGTSKTLDANFNEIRPAALICLEDDGTVKWTRSFPAMTTPDPQTGLQYTTTSVSTIPFFADIDGDLNIDIIVGVGGDIFGEAGSNVVGQPGDKGGIYALDKDGNIKWFHESLDTIGGTDNTGEGRPDGVYGTPIVFDIDKDGLKDIIYNGWDQSMWILDAKTGTKKLSVHLADTIWSTPKIADLYRDSEFEILVSADITENTFAGTTTGGIFHVISGDGTQNSPGFDTPVGNPDFLTLRGKAEEQALWSSPVTADIDNDGFLEIIYGTGNFFHDNRGMYIRVWNHDGTEKFKLTTIGRTFSTPMVVDIDGDGDLEILATTLDGYIYGWDHNGNQLFATQTTTYKSVSIEPIFSSPIAIDLDNDGKLEIIYAQGTQIVMVDYSGNQISNSNKREMIFEQFKGSPAAKDIDNDGVMDLISGGTSPTKDQAVVYRWIAKSGITLASNSAVGRYQLSQSSYGIENFVKRFYLKVLNRNAETFGLRYWVDELVTGVRAGADVSRGFIFSQEFTNRNVTDEQFVTILYQAFFDREPDTGGYNYWLSEMNKGVSKFDILDGFLYSPEFGNLSRSYDILPVK